ncbi:MAG TPA: diaminopimelate epimerase [Thermoanaerobaculia bacterium]|nr:diaminopimelate epimerase [Thermoanaerobaculia bacterium]
MLPTSFVKMAGGGNDFLLFEADGRRLAEEDRRRIALLCRRGLSVGADGALFLSGGEEGRIHLDYFNADGGLASFCANGTRCAARYAVTRRLAAGDSPVLETGWAVIQARVADDLVTLELPALPPPGMPVEVRGEGLPATGIPIEVGVPHLVVFVDGDLEELAIKSLAPSLRRHPELPEGANVNFVKVTGPHSIAVRTYERGVEGETLACGSGVVASAVVAAREGLAAPPIVCVTKSGVAFTVAFVQRDGGVVEASLTGDAREIFEAELNEEAWQE